MSVSTPIPWVGPEELAARVARVREARLKKGGALDRDELRAVLPDEWEWAPPPRLEGVRVCRRCPRQYAPRITKYGRADTLCPRCRGFATARDRQESRSRKGRREAKARRAGVSAS